MQKKLMKSLIISLALFLMVSSLSLIANAEGTLRIGWPLEIDSLNPFLAYNASSYEVLQLNYDFLVNYGRNNEPVPGLAKSWEVSDDGKTWTYHIVENENWHDGEEITAEDAAFTLKFIKEKELSKFMSYVKNMEKIWAPDKYTLKIKTTKPQANMLNLVIPIVPEHIWGGMKKEEIETFQNLKPVGSGPFQVVDFEKGQFVKLKANKDYMYGSPNIDEVIFVHYENRTTMVEGLKLGEVDAIVRVPDNMIEGLDENDNIVARATQDNGFAELSFNVWDSEKSQGNPLINDLEVRKAISWGINKETIVNMATHGLADPGTTQVPPFLEEWHYEVPDGMKRGFSPVRAKAILENAGYVDRDGDGIREDSEGNPLKFSLLVRSGTPSDVKIGQMIHTWMQKIGIKINLEVVDTGTMSDRIYDNADFDMFIWGWGGDIDPSFILSIMTSDQIMSWSDSFYSNERYDNLYEEQLTTLDKEERQEIVHEMQKILYKDIPYDILYYYTKNIAHRTDKFEGWVRCPEGTGAILMTWNNDTYLEVELKE